MNPKPIRRSTTATPSGRKYIGSIIAIVFSLLPTTSIFTLPPSIHAFGHTGMGMIIGMSPALAPFVLVTSACACYLLVNLVVVVATLGRLVVGSDSAATCIADLMGYVVNPLISLITLTPYKTLRTAASSAKRSAAADSLLPAVPGAARNEAEPLYNKVQRETGYKHVPAPVVVPQPRQPDEPSHGRHAKPEEAEVSAQDAESAVRAAA